MTVKESRRYEMFVRVSEFGEKHREKFPEASVGGKAFAAVKAASEELAKQAASKMTTAKEGAKAKTVGRRALLEQLEVINSTARIIGVEVPGFEESFRLPMKRGDSSLLTAGRVFLAEAEAVKDKFIAHGLNDTFITELKDIVDQFAQAVRGREAGKSEQTQAQAGIDEAMASGIAAARTLDVIVRNQLRRDRVQLAVWRRERRVNPVKAKSASVAARTTAVPPAAIAPAVPKPAAPAPVVEEPVNGKEAETTERVAS